MLYPNVYRRFIESQMRLEADAREVLPYVSLFRAIHSLQLNCAQPQLTM